MDAMIVAAAAHEANRIWCDAHGDYSQPHWEDAPEWQRKSAVDGVQAIVQGKVTNPRDSHRNWYAYKEFEGWKYGPVKDPEKKEHPCMVPYEELPEEQRKKDAIFWGIVKALKDL
jgi:hypothetical protein